MKFIGELELNRLQKLLEDPTYFMLQGNGETEITTVLAVLRYINHTGRKIAVWGMGTWGEWFLDFCKKEDISVNLFVDKKFPSGQSGEVICRNPSDIEKVMDINEYYFVITIWSQSERPFVEKQLNEMGCNNYIFISDCAKDLPLLIDWYLYYKHDKKDICDVYNSLDDEESKDVYYEYVRAIMTNSSYKGSLHQTKKKYFECYKKLGDEVFLNIGACFGDTVVYFLEQYERFRKIYAVEADRWRYFYLERNLSLFNKEIQSRIERHNIFLNGDNCDKFADATLINMDVEGMEEELIEGLSDIIKKNRPVLSVCAYHLKEDVVKLPKQIKKLVSDYSIFFRKYPCCTTVMDVCKKGELVMYAVPNERR